MEAYLTEAFRAMNLLEEEDFNLSAGDETTKDILDFKTNDVEDTSIDVIDPEAEDEEDLEDSYIGKVILDCEVCHSPIFKAIEEVKIDEDSDLANIEDECPVCHSNDGFKIIGQVAPYQEDPELKIEIEDKEEVDDDVEDIDDYTGDEEDLDEDNDDEDLEDEEEDEDETPKKKDVKESYRRKSPRGRLAEDYARRRARYLNEMAKVEANEGEVKAYDNGRNIEKKVEGQRKRRGPLSKIFDELSGHPLIPSAKAVPEGPDKSKGEHKYKSSQITMAESPVGEPYEDIWIKYKGSKKPTTEELDKYFSFAKKVAKARNAKVYGPFKADKFGGKESKFGIDWFITINADDEVTAFNEKRKKSEEKSKKSGKNNNALWKNKVVPWLIEQGESEEDIKDYDEDSKEYSIKMYLKKHPEDKDTENKKSKKASSSMEFYPWLEKEKGIEGYEARRLKGDELKKYKDEWNKSKSKNESYRRRLKEFYSEEEGCDDPEFEEFLNNEYNMSCEEFNEMSEEEKSEIRSEYLGIDSYERMSEGFEKVDLELEDKIIHVSEEEKAPVPDAEMAMPIDDDLENELMAPEDEDEDMSLSAEEEGDEDFGELEEGGEDDLGDLEGAEEGGEDLGDEDLDSAPEEDIDIDEVDEDNLDELEESYLRRVYENVNSYKTTRIASKGNKLYVEGIIKFNSGINRATKFVFEANKCTSSGRVKFLGENAQIGKKNSFALIGSVENNKLIAESLHYNYGNIKGVSRIDENIFDRIKSGIKDMSAKRNDKKADKYEKKGDFAKAQQSRIAASENRRDADLARNKDKYGKFDAEGAIQDDNIRANFDDAKSRVADTSRENIARYKKERQDKADAKQARKDKFDQSVENAKQSVRDTYNRGKEAASDAVDYGKEQYAKAKDKVQSDINNTKEVLTQKEISRLSKKIGNPFKNCKSQQEVNSMLKKITERSKFNKTELAFLNQKAGEKKDELYFNK